MSRAVTSAATGCEPWLAECEERFGAELLRHLEGMLRSSDDASDVLQEVWIAAHRAPPEISPGSEARAWLYRVATNRALDRLATDGRRCALLCRRKHELRPDAPPAPDEILARLDDEARSRIRDRLAGLPRKQREAVWLRWIEGGDYAAIAERLECSRDSARANVYNGMKRLRMELFELWRENEA